MRVVKIEIALGGRKLVERDVSGRKISMSKGAIYIVESLPGADTRRRGERRSVIACR